MVASVADVVADVLEDMYFLKPALRLDLVNYSALARIIRPLVEERLGGQVELETIVMAIRRNAHVFARESTLSVFQVMKDSKVELETGLAFIKLKRKPGVYEQVMDFVKNLSSKEAENSYVVQRVDEVSIILPEHALEELERLPAVKKDKSVFVEKRTDLAIITVNLPVVSLDVPGIYSVLLAQISDLGVSLLTIVSSFTRISVVCKEEDAPLAYNKISKFIIESKKMAKINYF